MMNNYLKTRNEFGVDDLINSIFDDSMFMNNKHLMRTNIIDNENDVTIEVEMPGFNKDNIKMSLENGFLTIEGNNSLKEEKKHFLRKERYECNVSRSYFVGDDVKEEDIKASFKDGILNIVVKKVEEIEPVKKYIEIE